MARPVHPAAELFPMLGDFELGELMQDIRAHGLREPVLLSRDGRVIDGRNRLAACEQAGISPRFETFDGDEQAILDLVLSKNLHRRHLNESQRAMVASKITRRSDGRPSFKTGSIGLVSIPDAAQRLNVSEKSVKRARAVRHHGTPALVAAVERGEVAVSRAAAMVKARPAAPALRPASPTRNTPSHPELTRLVLWVRTGAELAASLGDPARMRERLAAAGPGFAVGSADILAIRTMLAGLTPAAEATP